MGGSSGVINIGGNITIGARGLFVNKKGKILELIPNSFKYRQIRNLAKENRYKYIKLGSSSRFALRDNKVFGFYGLRKFYHLIDDDTGVLVFYSIYKDHPEGKKFTKSRFDYYVEAAKYLFELNIFPEIVETCKVNLSCQIKVVGSNRVLLNLNTTASGLITKRLCVPQYDLDIENSVHRKVLKNVWIDKKFRPFQWKKSVLQSLYGDDFIENHPLFTEKEYKKFCKRINSIYKDQAVRFKKVSVGKWPPETKYGDVVYCVKNRQWYFGDLE